MQLESSKFRQAGVFEHVVRGPLASDPVEGVKRQLDLPIGDN